MGLGFNDLAERVANAILRGKNSALSDLEFYALEIGRWLKSPQRWMQVKGQLYYEDEHDIIFRKRTMIGEDGKLEVVENLPNNRIIDNQYGKMVNQKTNYLVGKPFVLEGKNDAYVAQLKQVFDDRFMLTLKNAVKNSLNHGIAWLYPYYDDEGKFAFRVFPGYEIYPFWRDSEHTILDAAIRLYSVEAYEGRTPVIVKKVEIYDKAGISCYIYDGTALIPDGTQYYIPGDTTYQQWKDAFVDGDPSGFDISYNPKSGLASFKQHKEPEPEPPKKEYMTKKKLEGLIADADTQISNLKDQFLAQTNGLVPYDDFLKDYAGDYSAVSYDTAEETILKSYGDQIQSIEGQKADWQENLDKKVLAAEKKKLKKESLLLQDQLDNFQLKTYSGIWKDDVTTADWLAKHGAIESKKQYFESKLLYTTDPDEISKWQDLIAQVEEFDIEGKSYYELQKQLNDIQFQINNLGKPPAPVASQFSPEAYGQRKDDAWTARFTDKYTADSYYRPLLDQTWDTLADEEKFAVWQYTHNSHPINRPLSGYNGRWGRSNYRGIGTIKWDNENGNYDGVLSSAAFKKKFANTTNPAYGAPMRDYQDVIAELTKGIDKSSMDKDVWLVRGSDINGLAGLLEGNTISFDDATKLLSSGDLVSLQGKVLGQKFQSHSFMSTGIADGTGFGGEISYKIYAPKGTKAIYAEPASYFGSTISGEEIYKTGKHYSSVGGEAEIIIQRGTTFRITDIQKKGGNSYEVKMEIVDQPDYYATGYEHTHDGGLTSEK